LDLAPPVAIVDVLLDVLVKGAHGAGFLRRPVAGCLGVPRFYAAAARCLVGMVMMVASPFHALWLTSRPPGSTGGRSHGSVALMARANATSGHPLASASQTTTAKSGTSMSRSHRPTVLRWTPRSSAISAWLMW